MANSLLENLGVALQAAFRANAHIAAVVGNKDGSTPHIEYAEQPIDFIQTGKGVIHIRPLEQEVVNDFEISGRTIFRYEMIFYGFDVRSQGTVVALLLRGLRNVFVNHGRTLLQAYLTDSGSNRLGASGEARVGALTPVPAESDQDLPVMQALIEIECDHVIPLVTA